MVIAGVDGCPLDPIWMAEFRGFFYGEGYLGITKNGTGRSGKVSLYTVRAQITLRDDDASMLYDIQAKLGGNVWFEPRGRLTLYAGGTRACLSRPYMAWRTRSAEHVGVIITILDMGVMPSKKRREVEIVREFLATVGKTGPGPTGVDRAVAYERILTIRSNLYENLIALHRPERKVAL